MSEEVKQPEIVLVGGSKDGAVTEQTPDTTAINNIVLNEAKDGPEYIDLYMPAAVTDKEGRPIYVHIGRYDASESKSYWDSLTQSEKDALVEAATKAEEFVEEEKVVEETVEETPVEEPTNTDSGDGENKPEEAAEVPVVTEHAVEEVTEVNEVETTEEPVENAEEPKGPVVESEHAEASEEKSE